MYNMGEAGMPPVLVAAGIVRDVVDYYCESLEALSASLEMYRRKLEPYNDMSPLSRPDALRSVLTRLTPERVAALAAALDCMAKFAPPAVPVDMEKRVQKTKDMERLQNVRDHLHKALDGVVP